MTESEEVLYAKEHSELVFDIPEGARFVGALYCREIGFYKKYYCKDGKYAGSSKAI